MRSIKDQALADPQMLERILREWQIMHEAIRESPVHFAIYGADDKLVAWNRSYEGNHPEAFESHRAEAEAGTLDYRTLLSYQIAQSLPADEVGAEIERLVEAQRSSDGTPVERRYPSVGYMRVYKYRLPSGAVAGLAMNISDLKEKEEELAKWWSAAQDTAERLRHANAEIEKLALHDDLTGLPNRRYLVRHLDELSDNAVAGHEAALLHIDLDRFKQINDTIGHTAGDYVLCHVSNILKLLVQPNDLATRIGGDEFIFVRANCQAEEAAALANEIVAAVSEPIDWRGHPCRIGASVGVTLFSPNEADLDALLPRADLALYRAKERGRGRLEVFDAAMQDEMVSNARLSDEIMDAIDRAEFFPVYQPQFSAADLSVSGVEALCRWRHPNGKILAPDTFMKIATQLSLIGSIDRIMFEKVGADFAHLEEKNLLPSSLSLNIGYERLLDADLAKQLGALRRPNLSVVVELLETLSLDAPEDEVLFAIDRLKESGIDIEIDDFGSCRASIVSLISVGPSALKIDRQIVMPCLESPNYRRLISAIVDIGQALGIKVVAEGVEAEDHVRLMRDLGCDVLQGYALARPMPLKDLISLLEDQDRAGIAGSLRQTH